MWAAFLTTLLYSVSTVSGSRAARYLGGTEANFWRLCFAAVLLAVYAHAFGAGTNGRAFATFFVSGCIGFGVGDMALYQALPRLGSRLSSLITLCLSAPLAALIEWAWLGTRLSFVEIVCAIVILAGVALALAPGQHLPSNERERAWGLGFGLLASVCQALGAVLSRKAFSLASAAGDNIDGLTAAYQRILGGLTIGLVVYALVKPQERSRAARAAEGMIQGAPPGPAPRQRQWRKAWPWLIFNGLTGPTLGVSCNLWALKTTPSGVVLPIVALTPIVIIPFAYWLEGERPSGRSLLGGALAVAGAAALALAKNS